MKFHLDACMLVDAVRQTEGAPTWCFLCVVGLVKM